MSRIDSIRGNSLYGLDNYCCGKNSLGSLFARGHYGIGSELVGVSMEKVRKMIERCDVPQGFMLSYGLGGGTGSGMGTLLMSKIREEYPDKIMSTPILFPHKHSQGTVLEIYNAVLSMHYNMADSDLTLSFDNPAINKYLTHNYPIGSPSLDD